MKSFLFILIFTISEGLFSQADVRFFTNASFNAGYGAYVIRHFNAYLYDQDKQEFVIHTINYLDRGGVIGCRARAGVSWHKLRAGFQFGYDKLLLRKYRIYVKPPSYDPIIAGKGNMKIDFNIFSYSAFCGYCFKISKMLNLIPQIGIGSFSGFMRDFTYTTINGPEGLKWGFHNFMKDKFEFSLTCMFEIPFKKFSVFISPEYGFFFWKNMQFANSGYKTISHISAGTIEVGIEANLYTLRLSSKN